MLRHDNDASAFVLPVNSTRFCLRRLDWLKAKQPF